MTIDRLTLNDSEARSADPVAANVAALKALFPAAVADGRIDFDTLRQLLGDEVDDGDERYGLNWPDKRRARRLALTPSNGTLRPAREDSVNWDSTRNLIIEGDNLEVLKLLQKSYPNKAKLIYIDPPYNTGNDFVYPDDYQDSLANYLRRTGQIDTDGVRNSSNPEDGGRFHSAWLNMVYPRLIVASRLLSAEGAIFVSVDDNELHNLISVMSEVFGSERYVATVSAVTNLKGRNDKAHIATAHEYVVIFAGPEFVSRGFPLTDEQRAAFDQVDEQGRSFAYRDMRKRGGPDRREDRPKMYFPIYWDGKTGRCSLERTSPEDVEVLPKRGDGSDGRWRWGIDTVKANLPWLRAKQSSKSGRLDVDHRVYLDPSVRLGSEAEEDNDEDETIERSSKPKSIWIGGSLSTDSGNRTVKELFDSSIFSFPKSVDLIKNMVVMSTSGDDLVLDFFAGSGTTGHAVIAQNAIDDGIRRYILVQLPEELDPADKDQKVAADFCNSIGKARNIAELTKERLRRAAVKVKTDHPDTKADLGFRVYKLATSNLRAWEPGQDLAADLIAAADNVVQGRTEEDLLTELLLKQGIDLTEPMLTEAIAGAPVHAMGGGVLVVCLAPVTAANAEALADGIADWILRLNPVAATTVFFKDAGFENDVAKANVAAILEQRLEDQLLKVRSL